MAIDRRDILNQLLCEHGWVPSEVAKIVDAYDNWPGELRDAVLLVRAEIRSTYGVGLGEVVSAVDAMTRFPSLRPAAKVAIQALDASRQSITQPKST